MAYEELNSYLMEARYSLSRFYLLTGSLEAVKVQVDNLQVKRNTMPLATLRMDFRINVVLIAWMQYMYILADNE